MGNPTVEQDATDVLLQSIRYIPDFPKPGVTFADLGPLYENLVRKNEVIDRAVNLSRALGRPDAVVGIESRGFIWGGIISTVLNVPFFTMRKPGKLPGPVRVVEYDTEYSKDRLEIQEAQLRLLARKRVWVVDDVLATGGTLSAVDSLLVMNGIEEIENVVIYDVGIPDCPVREKTTVLVGK